MKRFLFAGAVATAVVFAGQAFANSSKAADGIASYAGATDFSSKAKAKSSRRATKKGANKFCPPGQAKKPGKGSAFNC
jgi:hypothetical protein